MFDWQGYAGGDEAKMLQRRLLGRSAKIGVGANRAATAAHFFERYGYMDPGPATCLERLCFDQTMGSHLDADKIGAVILDDGMQVVVFLFQFPLHSIPVHFCSYIKKKKNCCYKLLPLAEYSLIF